MNFVRRIPHLTGALPGGRDLRDTGPWRLHPAFPAQRSKAHARAVGILGALFFNCLLAILLLGPMARQIGDADGAGRRAGESFINVSVFEAAKPVSNPAPSAATANRPSVESTARRSEEPAISPPVPTTSATTQGSDSAQSAGSAMAGQSTAIADDLPADLVSEYERRLLTHIAAFRRYPGGPGADIPLGVVQVMFALTREGQVTGVWIQNSSGSELLDREAVATVLRAQPLPPIPQPLPETLNITLPISFAPRP